MVARLQYASVTKHALARFLRVGRQSSNGRFETAAPGDLDARKARDISLRMFLALRWEGWPIALSQQILSGLEPESQCTPHMKPGARGVRSSFAGYGNKTICSGG